MSNTWFRFKQFTIEQSDTVMKVNTDGVLLGAWSPVSAYERILDVGTGTGVIALMLAQRSTDAKIDAVELDERSAKQAEHNVKKSRWSNRISVIHTSFQQFAEKSHEQYELIVSNPPYFVDALLPHDEKRLLSRHTEALSYDELLDGAVKLLHKDGCMSVILPYVEGNVFIAKAAAVGLYCIHKTNVYPFMGKPVKRLLLNFSRRAEPHCESSLFIHLPKSTDYTPEYKTLTKDFYLNF